MTNQEYEQKKSECWKEYFKHVVCGTDSHRYWFNKIFDRAYALGKQEKDVKKKRMCLRDRTKVCNQCHECDIDISNPYHNNVIL